jgi:RNA polymerase-binding transcription factor DksA
MRKCKECGKSIPKDRLEALPETHYCVKCSDKVGGDFEIEIVEETIEDGDSMEPVIHKKPRDIDD